MNPNTPPVKFNKTYLIKKGLLERKTNKDILADVKAKFPASPTTLVTVQWYRKEMRKAGENVPTARTANREQAMFDDILS